MVLFFSCGAFEIFSGQGNFIYGYPGIRGLPARIDPNHGVTVRTIFRDPDFPTWIIRVDLIGKIVGDKVFVETRKVEVHRLKQGFIWQLLSVPLAKHREG